MTNNRAGLRRLIAERPALTFPTPLLRDPIAEPSAACAAAQSPTGACARAAAPAAAPGAITFTQVFAEHAGYVLGLVRRLGVHEREAEDVAQEVFVIVHRQLPSFEGRSSLKTWLCGITLRATANHRRKAYRRRELPSAFTSEPFAEAHQEDDLERARLAAALQCALDALSEKLRDVFVLYEVEELPMDEVARLVGCPRFTAYTRLRAARSAIAAQLTRAAKRGGGR